jgi:hypothetical protein
VNVATFLAETDEMHLQQGPELVRDSRLAHPEAVGYLVHAQLVVR